MRQQAHEKSFEINVQAQRLFESERDKLTKQGYEKLNGDYDAKFNKINMD